MRPGPGRLQAMRPHPGGSPPPSRHPAKPLPSEECPLRSPQPVLAANTGSGPSPESHRDVRAASPGDSSALLDSVSEEICFNGNRQNPACRLPTPAGPNAASGLAPHPRRGGCEVLGGGHEAGEGIPGISLLAAPLRLLTGPQLPHPMSPATPPSLCCPGPENRCRLLPLPCWRQAPGTEGLLQAGRTPRPGHWPPWAPVSSRVKRPPQRASRGLGGAIRTLVTWHAEGARPRQASAWMISGLDTRHNRRAGGRLFLGVPETGPPNALSLTSVDSGRTAPPRVCPPAPC